MALRALLIDDDATLFSLLREYLASNDVTLHHASDGPTGLARLDAESFDAVLLDIMMPGIDGLEVLRRLRAKRSVPVIMLTAKGDETDRVVGLELGADDYLPKPFGPRELLARLRAVLRRASPNLADETLSAGPISVEVEARVARVDGKALELTGIEFDLLVALLRRSGRVVPRAALLDVAGRGATSVQERAVDVHISHLRKKLGSAAPRIRTVRGVGYVLTKDES